MINTMLSASIEPTAMSTLLGLFATVCKAVLTQVSAVVQVIVGNPFILFTTGILFLGGVIGILQRLLSRG